MLVAANLRKQFPIEAATWYGMIDRCHNPRSSAWKWYGARGIKVCDEWRESFEAFLRSVGPRPSAEHTIDRYPNNDGNYEPGNVRWATRQEQSNNTRSNRRLSHDRKTQTLADWAREIGIDSASLRQRIELHGVDAALSVARLDKHGAIGDPHGRSCRRKATGATGYKGVYRVGNRFEASVKIDGRKCYLGLFPTPEAAALAYNAKALEVFGDKARLNQVETIPCSS